jgi:hypothetical protein
MDSSNTEQVRVVLTGLEDGSEQGIERFAADLANTFHIPFDKARVIATSPPYTVKKSCTPEVAERLAHTLSRLGGTYVIEPLAPPARPDTMPMATPPAMASQASPAHHPPAPEPDPMGTIPLGSLAPLADPSAPAERGPGLAAPTTVAEVACTECGTLQPADHKACTNCYFPLPRAPRSAEPTASGVMEEAPAAGKSKEKGKPRLVVFSNVADGYGELQQAAAPVIVAAGLLFATAILNLWSMVFFREMTGTSGMVSSFIDIGLGIGLLKGSSGARTWVLVRAIIGGFLWGILALGTGDIAWFFFQEMYSVSLIILLIGRGSVIKAALVGAPNALVLGLAILGLGFMTIAGGMGAGMQAAALVAQADELQEQGRFQQAIGVYQDALEMTSSEEDREFQAVVYMNLGAAYMGEQDFVGAIPELQASVALEDSNADAHYLLAMSHFQTGQNQQAMDHLLRVQELDPTYPNLQNSIKAVRASGARYHY